MDTNPAFTVLSDVEQQPVQWFWKPRIPLGELTMIDGDPGTNKSGVVLTIAARMTIGARFPDGEKGAEGGVVLLAGEDSVSKTLIPRLRESSADLSRIAIPNRALTLPDDLDTLKEAVRAVEAKLVVIDPLMAYLGPNANGDQAVRKALTPLHDLADKMNLAVVMVRHLNKSGGRHALYRGSGSVGIIAATRSALLVAKAPHDPDLRVLCQTKSNLGPLAPSLLFEPVQTESGSVHVEWRGVCQYTAADLLARGSGQADRLEEAKDFLLDLLAAGPAEQWEVKDKATKAGLAYRTVERAKENLGIHSERKGWGPGGTWVWALPKPP